MKTIRVTTFAVLVLLYSVAQPAFELRNAQKTATSAAQFTGCVSTKIMSYFHYSLITREVIIAIIH